MDRAGTKEFVDRGELRALFFAFSFRNTPHQQVQRGLRERGGYPRQQRYFKSMSTSCEAKCASFFWMRKLVSRASADQPMSLILGKIICVSEGKTLLSTAPAAESSVERQNDATILSYGEEDERKAQSQLSFGWTGVDRTLERRCETWTW